MGKYETAAVFCLCVQTSLKHVRNGNEERWDSHIGIEICELDAGRFSAGDMSGKITVSEGVPKGDKGVLKQFWVSPEQVVFTFHI